ncbi:SDR family NAD(P)-dependent oxidoreductase [Erythrobacter arachoides]|uniref:SDR family NAD(P)-dependent oxidoreductase n=1 Tax=Aurantiacibacter arachoides TaxID=1850444 RepID=A0A845A2U1_9SPHN|nr:SDR family oxidoreductase [Aurantiacibacter arachoides]MXO93267.1 SDR family NAD(P)-dependent oxidoreductase [Aurantiacibacter arachoides]GGD50668.1 3-oxoacyl-ACP reductase [Aurantiacibacter arachoides]
MSILEGRVVVITGASSGIGEACALAFAAKGAKVVLAARRQERLAALASRIEAAGGDALAVVTDVTREDDVSALFAGTLRRFGAIDVLINNAGIAISTPVDEMTLATWRAVIDTNLTSAFLCSREAFRAMKARGRGRIVNVGSISARVPRDHSPAYAASKFGLDGLTRSLAIDGRPHRIAASIFHPGIVATEIAPGAITLDAEVAASPEDMADVIVHMCDIPDHLNFYEGMVMQIDLPFLGRG